MNDRLVDGVRFRLAVRPGDACANCLGARTVTVHTYNTDPRGRVTVGTLDEHCLRCVGTGAEPDTAHLLPATGLLPPGWRWATARDHADFPLLETYAVGAPAKWAP